MSTCRFRARALHAAALLISVLLLDSARASDGVEVCNKGTVSIGVAYLDDRRALLNTTNFWTASGWSWVDANRCYTVWWQTGIVHLVFAIRTPGGEFGVIRRPFNVRQLPILNRRDSLCVSQANFEASGAMNSPSSYVPPCAGAFKEVPTSVSLHLGERDKITLDVTPTPADYQRMAVSFADPATRQKQFTGYVDTLPSGYFLGTHSLFNKDVAGAIALIARYRASGFPALASPLYGSREVLSIHVGPFPSRTELESAKQRLRTIPALPQWAFEYHSK